MPEEIVPTEGSLDPKNLIHIIRGQQVMLDSDLAALYGVETKNLNKAVTRNAERFPGDFRFQLAKEEYESLRFQNGTSNTNTRGGRRYMPFAFSEQGVAMLSAVLRSSTATAVSIEIMRAFVEMRHFLAGNAALLERVAGLEYRQLAYQKSTDERFDKIFAYLDSHELPKQKIFFKGELFDARSLLSELVRLAIERLVLIDGYVDNRTLEILSKKKEDVACAVITFESSKLSSGDMDAFQAQYGSLKVVRTNDFHDRFLVVDGSVYHVGASVKDAGKKTFAISLIEDREMAKNLIRRIDELLLN